MLMLVTNILFIFLSSPNIIIDQLQFRTFKTRFEFPGVKNSDFEKNKTTGENMLCNAKLPLLASSDFLVRIW